MPKWLIRKCKDCGKWHAMYGYKLPFMKAFVVLHEIDADTWENLCLEIAVESAFERVN